jgi:hypothetical protein
MTIVLISSPGVMWGKFGEDNMGGHKCRWGDHIIEVYNVDYDPPGSDGVYVTATRDTIVGKQRIWLRRRDLIIGKPGRGVDCTATCPD